MPPLAKALIALLGVVGDAHSRGVSPRMTYGGWACAWSSRDNAAGSSNFPKSPQNCAAPIIRVGVVRQAFGVPRMGTCGLVALTSAWHAEYRSLDPGQVRPPRQRWMPWQQRARPVSQRIIGEAMVAAPVRGCCCGGLCERRVRPGCFALPVWQWRVSAQRHTTCRRSLGRWAAHACYPTRC